MTADVEFLVESAKEGDKGALEELILKVQGKIYGLSLRMLYDPSDAEDACQEILLKIVVNLGTFRGESAFTTWMYRVAANHLLNTRRRRAERNAMSFDEYEKDLELESAGDWDESRSEAVQYLFVEEIKTSCLLGLLLCLDREHRLAFLLVDVFDLNGEQGAAVLDISPAAFRKRLSRARSRIHDFLHKNCGLIDRKNPCQCGRHVAAQIGTSRFDDRNLVFAGHPRRMESENIKRRLIGEMDELNRIGFYYRKYLDFKAPTIFLDTIKNLVNSEKFTLLQ